jgi:DNA replicative helicase MCM subunit Mcm2 (Cdc46/Mcm family)
MNHLGWRSFHCSKCDHRWEWPCRDCFSLSKEACPRCGESEMPFNCELDSSIPHDHLGNLTVPYNWEPP